MPSLWLHRPVERGWLVVLAGNPDRALWHGGGDGPSVRRGELNEGRLVPRWNSGCWQHSRQHLWHHLWRSGPVAATHNGGLGGIINYIFFYSIVYMYM